MDKDVQTDAVKESLDKKLQNIDEELLHRAETERLIPTKNIEERMIKFQRECEDKYRKELIDQVINC
jgi:hypothetical protein